MSNSDYKPPYQITPAILRYIEQIGEALGGIRAAGQDAVVPQLRRKNRLQTIQASLAIEGNTLNLEQVTAVLSGKRILGQPREIQEVQNAFKAYESMAEWSPCSSTDMLTAHRLLMHGLVDELGRFRSGNVGIQRGGDMVHIAPPAARVPALVTDLLDWLKTTDEHPLVASCVFHYEFEFIHPFLDGNGRMGRLWQTLILSQWKSLFAMLSVESVIRDRQQDYYAALGLADSRADATAFVEFMLAAILQALGEAALFTDQVGDQVTDQVRRLLRVLESAPCGAADIMNKLGLSHRPTFRKNYLHPALAADLIDMTRPDAPRAQNQKYRLTPHGRRLKRRLADEGT